MATYPTPAQSGPPFLKYRKRAKDWSKNTLVSTYEDGSRDFNTSADNVSQFWDLDYDGLTETQADQLIDFWDAHGIATEFTFIEPREFPSDGTQGATFTTARFESFEYDHTKMWVNSIKVSIRVDPA